MLYNPLFSWDSPSLALNRCPHKANHRYKRNPEELGAATTPECTTLPFAHRPNANSAPSTPAHVRLGGYLRPEVRSGLH
jgi:hypothetical protein